MRLEENFNNYYEQLNESVKNVYQFIVVKQDDSTFEDTIEAYSYKQAKYLAQDKYKKCLIRNVHQITDNKEENKDGEQISMFNEANGNDSFEAAQKHYASLQTKEQEEKEYAITQIFKGFDFDRVEISQLIPDERYNMYFALTKYNEGEKVEDIKNLVTDLLEKMGAKNIKFNQASNSQGDAYLHGAFYIDGMSLR